MASRGRLRLEERIHPQVPLLSSIDDIDGADLEKDPRTSVVEIFNEPKSPFFPLRRSLLTVNGPRCIPRIFAVVCALAAAVAVATVLAVRGVQPSGAEAAPASIPSSHTSSLQNWNALAGLDIRLLPLGDSITAGFQSKDHNGYRKTLHDDLAQRNDVDFIGSVKRGNMSNNANEGHNGYRIDEIAKKCNPALAQQPSIVLLHAGTNDLRQGGHEDHASDHLGDLIDQIFDHAPNTTLLVAQIIGSSNATQQALIDTFNAQIPDLVKQRADAGKKVAVADMSHVLDVSADFADQWHPNNRGYVKLGKAWFHVIEEVYRQRGWVENAS